jgi:hypothetical protein
VPHIPPRRNNFRHHIRRWEKDHTPRKRMQSSSHNSNPYTLAPATTTWPITSKGLEKNYLFPLPSQHFKPNLPSWNLACRTIVPTLGSVLPPVTANLLRSTRQRVEEINQHLPPPNLLVCNQVHSLCRQQPPLHHSR